MPSDFFFEKKSGWISWKIKIKNLEGILGRNPGRLSGKTQRGVSGGIHKTIAVWISAISLEDFTKEVLE